MAKKKTAKKKAPSKTQAIRDQLAKTPDAPANDIAAAASKASGLDISPGLVYNVKSSNGATKKKRRKKSASKGTRRKQTSKETTPIEGVKHAGELMFQAVDLVMKAGYKEAQTMVEMAGKMVDRIRDKE